MLRFLRKYSNATLIKVLYGGLALLFVIWGVGAVGGERVNAVARVQGKTITRNELERAELQLQHRYEQMLRRLEESGQAPSQRLLLPETIELSPRDAVFVRQNLETLTKLGVGLSEFGDRTFLLDGLPPTVKASNSKQFAFELIDELKAAGTGVNVGRLSELVVAKTVCRHAVKANDILRDAEVLQLVEDLRRCDMPYTCPHGRPTLIEMNYKELEKKFGRAA